MTLLVQFLHLQQDYEYNLQLLDGRDAELERYDKEFDTNTQELAAKTNLISQLHARLAKAESGLRCSRFQSPEPCPSLGTKLLHESLPHKVQASTHHLQVVLACS